MRENPRYKVAEVVDCSVKDSSGVGGLDAGRARKLAEVLTAKSGCAQRNRKRGYYGNPRCHPSTMECLPGGLGNHYGPEDLYADI